MRRWCLSFTTQSNLIIFSSSDYNLKPHDEYIQTDDIPSTQGTLYSVSQRVPNVNTNFTGLCPSESSYPPEQAAYTTLTTEWEQPRMSQEISKEATGTIGEVVTDKQKTNG